MKNVILRSAIAAAFIAQSVAHAAPARVPSNAAAKAPSSPSAAAPEAHAAAEQAHAAAVAAALAGAAATADSAHVAQDAPAPAADALAAADAAAAAAAAMVEESVSEAAINAQVRFALLQDVKYELMKPFRIGMGNPIPHLDRMTQQPHSAALAESITRSFGIPALYSLERLPAAPGKVTYKLSSPARQFDTVDKHGLSWGPLVSTMELDTEGRNMAWSGRWESLTRMESDVALTLSGMNVTATQQRNAADVWLGQVTMQIVRIALGSPTEKDLFVIAHGEFKGNVSEQGKLVDLSYDMRAKSAAGMGEQIDHPRVQWRLTNVDQRQFEKILFSADSTAASLHATPFGREMRAAYIGFAKSAAANGTALHFDEISASYKGHKALITGKLTFMPLIDADFNSLQALSRKVNARFDVRVPMGLLSEVAGSAARRQAKRDAAVGDDPAAAAEAAADAAIASMVPSQAVAEGMVAQMVSSGFAVLNDGIISTTIEARQGAIVINGKPIARDAQPASARKGGKRPAGKAGKVKPRKAGK